MLHAKQDREVKVPDPSLHYRSVGQAMGAVLAAVLSASADFLAAGVAVFAAGSHGLPVNVPMAFR